MVTWAFYYDAAPQCMLTGNFSRFYEKKRILGVTSQMNIRLWGHTKNVQHRHKFNILLCVRKFIHQVQSPEKNTLLCFLNYNHFITVCVCVCLNNMGTIWFNEKIVVTRIQHRLIAQRIIQKCTWASNTKCI